MIVTRIDYHFEKYLWWSKKCNCDECGLENGWRKRSWKMGEEGEGEWMEEE